MPWLWYYTHALTSSVPLVTRWPACVTSNRPFAAALQSPPSKPRLFSLDVLSCLSLLQAATTWLVPSPWYSALHLRQHEPGYF